MNITKSKKQYIKCWDDHIEELVKMQSSRLTIGVQNELIDIRSRLKELVRVAANSNPNLK